MTYVLIGALLLLLAYQRWDSGKAVEAERAHSHKLLENVRELTDQIVLLKVQPQAAAAIAASDVELPDAYIQPLDDDALAEYELERAER